MESALQLIVNIRNNVSICYFAFTFTSKKERSRFLFRRRTWSLYYFFQITDLNLMTSILSLFLSFSPFSPSCILKRVCLTNAPSKGTSLHSSRNRERSSLRPFQTFLDRCACSRQKHEKPVGVKSEKKRGYETERVRMAGTRAQRGRNEFSRK